MPSIYVGTSHMITREMRASGAALIRGGTGLSGGGLSSVSASRPRQVCQVKEAEMTNVNVISVEISSDNDSGCSNCRRIHICEGWVFVK